jgi:hypothetical protein
MKKYFSIMISFVILTTFANQPAKADEKSILDEAFAKLGLTKENLRWTDRNLNDFQTDPFRFPWFDSLHTKPLEVPHEARITLDRIDACKTLKDYIVALARRSGHEVARFPTGSPQLSDTEPLFSEIKNLYREYGWKMSPKSEVAIKEKCSSLSKAWQINLANFIAYAKETKKYRDLALRKIDKVILDKFRAEIPFLLAETEEWPINAYDCALLFDFAFMYFGASQSAIATDMIIDLIGKEIPTNFYIDTPLGKISITDAQTNTHRHENQLLSIDTAGDDTYTGWAGSNKSLENPLSVCIDITGNDTYKTDYEHHNAFGSGFLGVGILADIEGNDIYEAKDLSLGAACFGVGILLDKTGNDIYSSRFLTQGSAEFGLGALLDNQGDDVYKAYSYCQGFGFTKAVGLLQDSNGNDVYEANDTDIINPSAQSQLHNTTMGQGAGFGLRAEYYNGHSMSGGCGILQDKAGNDKYSCGVFGQGVAYWHSFGIFSDYSGDDSYLGTWYVQGSCAHFAIAYFQDRSGNDTYQATMATSIGVGHDTSLGYHIDLSGNDIYKAFQTETKDGVESKADAGLVLGCGNNNGMGFFVNIGGDDIYHSKASPSLGMYGGAMPCAGSGMREEMINIGVFIDIGGNDTYEKEGVKNNISWVQKKPECNRNTDFGIGIDAKEGNSGPLF